MAARPRKSGSKDLPSYLYRKGSGYLYDHPQAKKTKFYPGDQKAEAIRVAQKMNAYFASVKKQSVVDSLGRARPPEISEALKAFTKDYLPRLQLKETTAKAYQFTFKRVNADLGSLRLDEVNQETLSNYLLDNYIGDGYDKTRARLNHFYKFCISRGWVTSNLAQGTLPSIKTGKQTRPHTLEALQAIQEHSPEWLQDMITVAMATLLRPDDLRNLKKEDVDMEKGTIRVAVGKTTNYKEAVYLEIYMNSLMFNPAEAIQRRLKSGLVSPYVFAYRPHDRAKKDQVEKKKHWSYITKGKLSKTFREARNAAGVYDHLPVNQRPTFKEIRNFGAQMLRDHQYPEDFIQKLMGHKRFTTTQIYLDDGKPKYQKVEL